MSDRRSRAPSVLDPALLGPAIRDSFVRLDPRVVAKNPVMFVVEAGSVVTTVLWVRDLVSDAPSLPPWFTGAVTAWLWVTVLFANFAEALAEGRGRAQAAALRRTRRETPALRIRDGRKEPVSSSDLVRGDLVVVRAGMTIPGDGDVVEGIASVDE